MRKAATGLACLVAAIYLLNHGVFIGSSDWTREGFRYKTCRYLFVTGAVTLPARGGFVPGTELEAQPEGMHCRIFGD